MTIPLILYLPNILHHVCMASDKCKPGQYMYKSSPVHCRPGEPSPASAAAATITFACRSDADEEPSLPGHPL